MTVEEAVRAAEQIQGWMTREELRWLAEQAKTQQPIVEIGSWKGRSTKALASMTPGTVYAVDHWEYGLNKNGIPGPGPELREGSEIVFARFQENLNQEIRSGRVTVWRSRSRSAAEIFGKTSLLAGMVFIDGDHDYESVKADIQVWSRLLRPGGLLCGHDHTKEWPGVVKAVDELVPERKIIPNGTIWYEAST